ncbi:MAG: TrmB family transcriptional regulator [Euryarchaeota archaeon]|nr:TrmB family transcriptional regulator [Euryarchaeota archaeon]
MDFLQLMELDPDILMREYRSVVEILGKCGLGEYQARAYLSLVAHGEASADEVAEVSRIPRTSAYKALHALCETGWAKSLGGRPELFVPTPPEDMAARIVGPISEAFGKMAQVKGILSARGTPQMVFTIVGRQRVLRKLGEVVDGTTQTLVISTPQFSLLRTAIRKQLKNAVRRGITITVLTGPHQRVMEGVVVHKRTGLIATDLISDGKVALIAAPDMEACGYTDNPELARHLEDFLKIIISGN